MPQATVTIDGEAHDVDLSAITLPEGHRILAPGEVPDGLVSQETMDASIQDRLARQKRALASNREFVQSILEAHGVPLDEEGQVVIPSAEEVDEDAMRERIKATVLREQVEPLQKSLTEAEERNKRLLDSRKQGQLMNAARKAGVHDYLLDPPVEGAKPPIVGLLGDALGYDDERDTFAVIDGDGFRPSSKQGKIYADEHDLFDGLKKDSAWKHIFKPSGPTGPHVGDTNGQVPSNLKRSTMTRKQKIEYVKEHGGGEEGLKAYNDLPE